MRIFLVCLRLDWRVSLKNGVHYEIRNANRSNPNHANPKDKENKCPKIESVRLNTP